MKNSTDLAGMRLGWPPTVAVMAALAAIRGLPADQGGDGGGPSKKRKENGA